MMEARKIQIEGIVQGVGFRPFVYRIANEHKIKGWIKNTTSGVDIHAEGEGGSLAIFLSQLREEPPRQALIKAFRARKASFSGFTDFNIVESQGKGIKDVLVAPDIAICPDCYREFQDPRDRRHHYPFINCTNCGPRFTIIKDIPYDRSKTTMANFPMCPDCRAEYQNPLDRRFHAQPNACPLCGPQIRILDNNGRAIKSEEPWRLLVAGNILAVKGLGGYHLVCDALNPTAVFRLRANKKREFKPFALMAQDLQVAGEYGQLTPLAEELLQSPQGPIVILDRTAKDLPVSIAPGLKTLGIMLPYTPLHYRLFGPKLSLLVMTSGNLSSNPLIYQDNEALEALKDVVDFFLVHNRDIYNRCDDSIVRVVANKAQLIRRARGYVPCPIEIPSQPSILACGGDLKSTFCLTKGTQAFLSQHLGDLDNYNNLLEYAKTAERIESYLNIKPQAVAVDLHPGYNSRGWGIERGLPVIEVQHHHGHLVSCLAENGISEKTLGVICDGTGYGTDGHIWGMEFLLGDAQGFARLAHLEYVPMPGGEKALEEPLRMTVSYLYRYLGLAGLAKLKKYLPHLEGELLEVSIKQIEQGINAPLTSSCGRLFDAVSGLLGICSQVNYEGEAAIRLEEVAEASYRGQGYEFTLERAEGKIRLSPAGIWKGLVEDIEKDINIKIMAAKFHITIAEMIVATCIALKEVLPSKKVALSGGVMQNRLLVELLVGKLEKQGFLPITHQLVPANDGGLSLGQAVIGGRFFQCV